ncbi:MAG TPA: NAD(P)H-dependent oxidoreductase subunit E [Nitrospirota bacterium]|nr:NAD(P)H-dependent oxidoreductase subunit E [Nitrospirota bacterium]
MHDDDEAPQVEPAKSDTITPEMYGKIDGIIEKYKDKPGSLIPVLQQAQDVCGYLPHVVQRYIARGLKMSPSVVFGVATFYSFFTLVPRGKHVIRVCLGTACYVKRSEEILDKLKDELDIEVGEITRDKKYSLEAVRCLGACGLAPVVVVGQDTYGDVLATKVMEIVKKYE